MPSSMSVFKRTRLKTSTKPRYINDKKIYGIYKISPKCEKSAISNKFARGLVVNVPAFTKISFMGFGYSE